MKTNISFVIAVPFFRLNTQEAKRLNHKCACEYLTASSAYPLLSVIPSLSVFEADLLETICNPPRSETQSHISLTHEKSAYCTFLLAAINQRCAGRRSKHACQKSSGDQHTLCRCINTHICSSLFFFESLKITVDKLILYDIYHRDS